MIAVRKERSGESLAQAFVMLVCLTLYGVACHELEYYGSDSGKVIGLLILFALAGYAFVKLGPGRLRWILTVESIVGFTFGYWLISLL